jgi:hypothetical protein
MTTRGVLSAVLVACAAASLISTRGMAAEQRVRFYRVAGRTQSREKTAAWE